MMEDSTNGRSPLEGTPKDLTTLSSLQHHPLPPPLRYPYPFTIQLGSDSKDVSQAITDGQLTPEMVSMAVYSLLLSLGEALVNLVILTSIPRSLKCGQPNDY